ncbi:MAG: single-stranded-DNA-specific exonuclease RecJ [Candidatus Omnitrophica bacterium]|nr:single-stranded-DNA-specific exonuclease RecJ [Candidatus Omnitrophota bacterium]
MDKRWLIRSCDPFLQKTFSDELGIPPIIAQLLINRGITTVCEAGSFLSPDLSSLYDPFLLTDMGKAVRRIEQARSRGEKVLIYGDYDVDGVTSSALLCITLKRLGITAISYIPHRMEEGYGLNDTVAQFARSQGAHLIITVDCGINAFGPVDAINAAGMDVIIIDHHEPDGDVLPKALAVIDPKRSDCSYPFKGLCAVGLAAKLAQALLGEIPEEDLDLVALGTVADVAPLRGENRIFVKKGLPLIANTQKHGLRALLEAAKISGKKMKPYYVGFIIGPRLNAAGRMDSANIALDLLLSDNAPRARVLAQSLETHNQSRQKMQTAVVEEAMAMIEDSALKDQQVIVVHKEGWHKGVLGIVASRIVEKYYRPTVVISVQDGMGTGSARSIDGFHVQEALAHCAGVLENFGGHQRAAGLRLKHERIEEFRLAINDLAKDLLTGEQMVPALDIDCEIPLSAIDRNLAALIESLEPHGEGNPSPVFCSRGVLVKSDPAILGRDTIKFWVTDGTRTLSAVGFGLGAFKDRIQMGAKVDLAYGLGLDDWNKPHQSMPDGFVQDDLDALKVGEHLTERFSDNFGTGAAFFLFHTAPFIFSAGNRMFAADHTKSHGNEYTGNGLFVK